MRPTLGRLARRPRGCDEQSSWRSVWHCNDAWHFPDRIMLVVVSRVRNTGAGIHDGQHGTPRRRSKVRSETEERTMPDKATIERAKMDAKQGKAPTTQAGEFVREEIHHIREGKHGARSPAQAIAIGLSKARKAGVKLPPKPGTKTADASTKEGQKRTRSTETSASGPRDVVRAEEGAQIDSFARGLGATGPQDRAQTRSLQSPRFGDEGGCDQGPHGTSRARTRRRRRASTRTERQTGAASPVRRA